MDSEKLLEGKSEREEAKKEIEGDSEGKHNMEYFTNKTAPPVGVDYFMAVLGVAQVVCIVLHGLFTDYEDPSSTSMADESYYFTVAVMVLLGFALLMTFLQRYALGSVGYTLLIIAVSVQWAVLMDGFWEGAYHQHFHKIKIGTKSVLEANFAAAAILISFGGIIGKCTPTQVIVLALIEAAFYTLNTVLVLKWLEAADVGGTITIHMFGASFGLAAAYALGKPSEVGEENESTSRTSDVLSLVGTILLWVLWPAFNAAEAKPGSKAETVAIINTLFAISSGCVFAFITSRLMSGHRQFQQPEIQNATLAGGVAMGSAANMIVRPAGAMAIGGFAGFLSVWGFAWLQPRIRELGLHDTCGILNLHGMPSILGALVSVVIAAFASKSDGYNDEYDSVFPQGKKQAWYQLAATGLTLLIAILSGFLTGALVSVFPDNMKKIKNFAFRDDPFWDMDTGMQKQHL